MDHTHTYIGRTTTQHELWLSAQERKTHQAILGASGSGKSVMLEHLAAQSIAAGDGILLLDVAGNLAEAVLRHVPPRRYNEVSWLRVGDEYPVGLNILEDTNPDGRAVVADAVVAAMRSIWRDSWGPRLETILRHSVRVLIEIPNASLILLPRLLTDSGFRRRAVRRVSDPFTRSFFEQQYDAWRDSFRDEAIVSVLNKVESFLAFPHVRNILGQGRSTLHLDQAMARGRIVVVSLAKTQIGETAAHLMGALLLANVVSKMSLGQAKDFHVLVDEAHNFGGTQALAVLLQEARKHSVSCAIVTQHLAALDEKTRAALLGNAHTLICFRMGSEDAALIAPAFNREHQEFNAHRLTHLERGEAVVRIGAGDAHVVDIPPPHEGRASLEVILKQSRLHYGVARAKVERNISRALGAAYQPRL
jgi:hypothetical protein